MKCLFALLLLSSTVPVFSTSCRCYACAGRKRANWAHSCLGRSRGCTVEDQHSGCYGQEQGGRWRTGQCMCARGHFSEPDEFWLHGRVSGLAPHSVLIASASSPVALHERSMRDGERLQTMTSHIGWNGKFSFPYKLADGQRYIVSVDVARHTNGAGAGQHCRVIGGASGIATRNVEDVQIQCSPAPHALGRYPHMHPHIAAAAASSSQRLPHSICADSDALHAGDTDIVETSDTTLPCGRHWHSGGGEEWMTPFMGHKCVAYVVTASAPVTVCLVPDVSWFTLGRRKVLAKRGKGAFCDDACRGKRGCRGKLAHADIDSSYLLWVTPLTAGAPYTLDVSASACMSGASKAAKTKKLVLQGAAVAAVLGIAAFAASKRGAPSNAGYARINRRNQL